MTPTERILAALTERECNPKRCSKGWSARCPAHEDRQPSLSVSEGDDGRVLVNCHAGCTVDAVCCELGLQITDLMAEGDDGRAKNSKGKPGEPLKKYKSAKSAISALERSNGKRSQAWTYCDAAGEPVGVIVRWDKSDGKKILPVSRNDDGWTITGIPEPRPLYCLRDLAGADRVFICEGEKAADGARSINFVGTTSAHGAESPDKTDWSPLANKDCVILPDNNQAGKNYAARVTAILAALSPAPSVRVVELPGLPDGGDIVDWIDQHGDAAEPDAMAVEVTAMVELAKPLDLGDKKSEKKDGPFEFSVLTAAELDAAEFDLEFIVKSVLVARHNCGIIGGSKTLKTSLAVDLGISLATAGYFLGYFEVTRKCRTCLMSGESGLPVLQDTARRIAAEANWLLREIDGLLFSDMLPRLEDLTHIVALERLIQQQRIEVLIIDPMYLAIDVNGKESSMFAMGRVLRNVGQICQEQGVTLVMCHHAKQSATRDPKKPDFRDAAFAGFEQFFSQWVCVSRRSEYQAGSGKHELWMRCEGRMGHSGQWALDVDEGVYDGPGTRIWKTQLTSENNAEHAAAAKQEAEQHEREQRKLDADCQNLLKAYQRFSSGETMKQIAAIAGISHQRFAVVNATLLDDALVEICKVQKSCRKTPYDGFKLTTKGQLYDHRDRRD